MLPGCMACAGLPHIVESVPGLRLRRCWELVGSHVFQQAQQGPTYVVAAHACHRSGVRCVVMLQSIFGSALRLRAAAVVACAVTV
jgi:hypothetical protein